MYPAQTGLDPQARLVGMDDVFVSQPTPDFF
jgi:hypothetical protein